MPAMMSGADVPSTMSLMPSSQMMVVRPDRLRTSRSSRASMDGPPRAGASSEYVSGPRMRFPPIPALTTDTRVPRAACRSRAPTSAFSNAKSRTGCAACIAEWIRPMHGTRPGRDPGLCIATISGSCADHRQGTHANSCEPSHQAQCLDHCVPCRLDPGHRSSRRQLQARDTFRHLDTGLPMDPHHLRDRALQAMTPSRCLRLARGNRR